MRKSLLLAGTALALLWSAVPAAADPVITPFLATLGTAFVTAGGTLTTLGSITSFVIQAALAVGLSTAANALMGPNAPKPADVTAVLKQDLPPRMRHYGVRRVGGALIFIEVDDKGAIYMVIAHGDGPWDGFDQWFVDGRAVLLDGDGWIATSPYETSSYASKVKIETRLGTATQAAFAEIVAEFPAIWTSAHQAKGIVTSYLYGKTVGADGFRKIYPNGVPSWNVIARTGLVYDPRDEAQSADDASTWEFSRLLPLQLADYLTHPDGMAIPRSAINTARLAAAADIAAATLPTKAGGTVQRYAGGLSYSLDAEPASVIARFLRAMDGRLVLLPDGTIAIDCGIWSEPTVVIEDGDIIEYTLDDTSGPQSKATDVIVKYTFAEAAYAETQADTWVGDGGGSFADETLSIEAFEIESHHHARRIAKLAQRRASPDLQGTITTNLSGLRAWDQRFVRIRGTVLDLDRTFEVVGIALDIEAGRVTLQVISLDADAYDFDAMTEEGTAPTVPEILEEGELAPPENVEAVASTLDLAGGVTVAVIDVTWDAPERDDLDVQAQWSLAGAEAWFDFPVSRNAHQARASNLIDGETYDIRVRFLGPNGGATSWVVVEDILATADPVAPDPVTNVAGLGDVGEATITWDTPASVNYKAARIFQSATNTFGSATQVDIVYGFPASSGEVTITGLSAGTLYFWVVAINPSGVAAAAVGTGAVTIT